MEENNIQSKSMWQKPISNQSQEPQSNKKFPVLLVLIAIIFLFLVCVAIYLIVNYKREETQEKNTTTQSAQRAFNIEEATKESSPKTVEDSQGEEIKELTDLDDDLDETLTDLENSLTDIGDYQTQDDDMPEL